MSKPGAFSKENQPANRRPRGPDKRSLLLDALKHTMRDAAGEEFETKEQAESAFSRVLIARALNVRDPASAVLMKEVLVRLYPTDKATMPLVQFPFRTDGTPAQKIEDVQSAVADGVLSVDTGNTMVNMIVAGIKVFEVTELADRLARIEEMLAAADGEG